MKFDNKITKTEGEISIVYQYNDYCLCTGQLIVMINGSYYDFGKRGIATTGSYGLMDNFEEFFEDGPWEIKKWPDNFPEQYKNRVIELVNKVIPWGCSICGGCI